MNKLTKQIISFALVLYTVFMLCFTAFAAETTNKVNYDKTSVEDDLKSVYGDVLSLKFPKISIASSDISVIYVFENGYDAKEGIGSSDYGLYVYMYIPSGIKLSSSILHTANIACGWEAGAPNDFENVHLELLSQSENGTLAKFKVIGLSLSNVYISDKERSYCISSVDIYSGGTNAKANRVAKVFTFYEKNGERKCKTKDLTVVDIDVYQTSYLSGGSAKGANYSNQVNTAVFSIPNDLIDKYGDLYSVKYEYYKYRTAPIFIIDSSKTVSESSSKKIYDQLISDRGKIADDSWYYSILDYTVGPPYPTSYLYYEYWMAYGRDDAGSLSRGLVGMINYWCADSFWKLNNLTTVFSASDITDHDKVFVSADELQQYFLEYDKSFYNGKVRDKYSADLFDLNCFSEDDIYHCETISVDDSAVTLPSYKDVYGWFNAWLRKQKDETVTYDPIYQLGVSVDDFNGTDEEISERLLVSPSSVTRIKEIYSEAGKDSTVFLLRYASSDDYFTSDYLEFANYSAEEKETVEKICFYSCETVYLDFDIIQFSFMNDESEEITVISVNSSPTDGFTDVMNTNGATPKPEGGCDGFDSFKEVIAILLVCVLIYFVISIYSKLKRNKIVVNIQDKNDRRRD